MRFLSWVLINSSVNEIKEGCISGFVNVNVNPLNPYFKEFDDGKIIIGKSSPSSDLFDSLVFCNRNIRKIKIPDLRFEADRIAQEINIPLPNSTRKNNEALMQWFDSNWDLIEPKLRDLKGKIKNKA